MSAPTFKSHSVTCPVCNRSSAMPPVDMVQGLFICPHCHANLVISWSGHYVRDPFMLQPVTVGQMLRRQSRPLARLRRDIGLTKHLSLLAVLGSAIIFGLTLVAVEQSHPEQNPLNGLFEWVNTQQTF